MLAAITWLRWLAVGGLLLAWEMPVPAKGGDDLEPPLRLKLVAEQETVVPGEITTVGLFIEHAARHHSYWKFPGIVGVPTSLQWTVPEGFAVGEIIWPTPEEVDMRGHGAYGFHQDTLLMVEIYVPAELEPNGSVTLGAKVAYMCCSPERCVPGFEDLTMTLPLGEQAVRSAKWQPVFEKTRQDIAPVAVGWKGRAVEKGEDVYEVTLVPPSGVPHPDAADLYWFSLNGFINSEKPQVRHWEDGSLIMRLAKHPFIDESQQTFQGILTAKSGWPQTGTSGLRIEVPLLKRLALPE